jgi:RNA polymerase sigma-70 factor (ECF subfamily)
MNTTELELIKRIAGGDIEAEKEIIILYKDKITQFVRSRLGYKNADCSDLVNDTLLGLLLKLRNQKFDPASGKSLNSYVFGIAHHKVCSYFEASDKSRIIYQDEETFLNIVSEDESPLEKEELQNAVRNILKKLHPKYQAVLFLRFYAELSVSEISEQLGLPSRRTSERIHYALQLVRKKCKKEKLFSIFPPFL